ncbi:MAG TPA: FkbM family methyltransferase [Actinomycetota bacterium]|nr:FkbM family methyltransferase [Actinomycetota bacterium]
MASADDHGLVRGSGEKLLIARVEVAERLTTIFAVDPASTDPISVWLGQQPTFDDLPLRLFLDLAETAKTVVDVGAHVGTFSLPAATLGCRVIAIEGSPENARLLAIAKGLNNLERLEVVNAVASDRGGTQSFTAHGPWGHVSITGALPDIPRVDVQSVRLDELLRRRGLETIDLMKIDIEGYELAALRGLAEFLRTRSVAHIIFESNASMLENYGLAPQDLLKYLSDFGYQIYYIDRENPGSLVTIDPMFVQPDCVADYLATTSAPALERWAVAPPLRLAETLERVLECTTSDNAGFRRYAAKLLVEGPTWLRGWPESRDPLERLAEDENAEVRKIVTPTVVAARLLDPEPTAGHPRIEDTQESQDDSWDEAKTEHDPNPVSNHLYDSYRKRVGIAPMVKNIRAHRGLIKLLVRRDLTLRYRRSLLGVWWAMLHPMLNVLVMWLVFAHIFQIAVTDVPYVVYLLSGIIVFSFFSQAVQNVGASLVGSEGILMRLHVPSEVLSFSSALGTAANTAILLVPLLILQVAIGPGVSPALPVALLILTLALLFAVGTGLIVASVAVRFPDALTLTTVVTQLLAFLTPTFYPVDAIPFPYRWAILSNPLTHFVRLFRSAIYGGPLDSWRSWTVIGVLTAGSLFLGTRFFSRASRRAVVVMQ